MENQFLTQFVVTECLADSSDSSDIEIDNKKHKQCKVNKSVEQLCKQKSAKLEKDITKSVNKNITTEKMAKDITNMTTKMYGSIMSTVINGIKL